ncbi:hypothetical protein [Paenibacillus sp. Leaf72]|nr:hypothetical protein [Paenibacillus sp. Leaf72]
MKNNQIISKELLDEISSFKINLINDELDLDEKTDLLKRVQSLVE